MQYAFSVLDTLPFNRDPSVLKQSIAPPAMIRTSYSKLNVKILEITVHDLFTLTSHQNFLEITAHDLFTLTKH